MMLAFRWTAAYWFGVSAEHNIINSSRVQTSSF